MNKKRKIILEMLELDQSISSAQKSQIESILRNKLTSQHPILLKQREVAQLMGVSRQTVYNLKKSGLITPIQVTSSGCERYKRDDILKFINDRMYKEIERKNNFLDSNPRFDDFGKQAGNTTHKGDLYE